MMSTGQATSPTIQGIDDMTARQWLRLTQTPTITVYDPTCGACETTLSPTRYSDWECGSCGHTWPANHHNGDSGIPPASGSYTPYVIEPWKAWRLSGADPQVRDELAARGLGQCFTCGYMWPCDEHAPRKDQA